MPENLKIHVFASGSPTSQLPNEGYDGTKKGQEQLWEATMDQIYRERD